MLKRFSAVIISSIILTLGISLTSQTPEEQRDPHVYYMGISEVFIFTFWFSLIFYSAIGIPSSWVIDKGRQRFNVASCYKRYFRGKALYSLAGIIFGAIFYSTVGYIHFFLDIFLESIALCLIASILYFQILWIFERKFSKTQAKKRTNS
ncbi:hypothetical protein B0H99_10335 [Planomicrobium soli]|uniref:Uncharacterized protein n=1 Tax=Planomicrobium soli TaxID=1176648 RepID=A0A2P8H3X0_9BACL|nr:hypothetical protein [Planomicrobium soli]PSL40903.1 hypothetical protein B0H99_10335 [Planomicrobium soli]